MISVIVPVYKTEKYLRQCVDSIREQTYEDLEILLIDDGSPDRCGTICDEYGEKDTRIRVFHTENNGLSAARNLGIREARGEYITFVDSDDWLDPDMFERLLNKLEQTGADVAACGYWREWPAYSEQMYLTDTVYESEGALEALIDGKITNHAWNKLFRRQLFDNISFPEGRTYEDIAVMHKVMSHVQTAAAEAQPKYHYRKREDSIMKNNTADNLASYARSCLERYRYIRDEKPDLFEKKHEQLLRTTAEGIAKLWRWWYACSPDDRRKYAGMTEELKEFSREHIPLFGRRSWPFWVRLPAPFMRSTAKASFAASYYLTRIFRITR